MKYLKMPESNLTCNSLVQLSDEPYIRNGKSWFVSKIVESLVFNQGWAEGMKSTPTSFLKIASFRRNRFLKFQPPQFLIRQRDPSSLKQFTCSKLVRFILQVSTKTYENKMKQKLSKLKKTFLFTIPLRINFFRKTIFRNNKPTRVNTA